MKTTIHVYTHYGYAPSSLTIEASDYDWAKVIVDNNGDCRQSIVKLAGVNTISDLDSLPCKVCPLNAKLKLVDKPCTLFYAREVALEVMNEEAKKIVEE